MPNLDFKGKQFVYAHHLTVPFRELKVDSGRSLPYGKGPSLDDNLIIHGDNLHALKALLPKYAGKIKCIYIDPPYNTGNEKWRYNDNVNSPLIQNWIGKVVDNEDMEKHDEWLCMMWPRLQLLRYLLREDGAIFVSIDDNEVHHLRSIMDEIFGESNFLSQITWRNKKEISSDNKGIASKTEFILAYTKSELFIPNRVELNEDYVKSSFKNPNNDPKGLWRGVAITASKGHQGGGYEYEITTPGGRKIKRKWLYPKHSYEKLVKEGRIYFGKDGKSIPQRIMYLSESKGQVPDNLWLEAGTNKEGKNELTNLFQRKIFDTPKPVSLITKILEISCDDGDIILDSFAGSGTTGQSVLELNNEDGGNRKFILVECENYADELTAERMRLLINGVPYAKDKNLKSGLGGDFTYCEIL